MLFEYFLRPPYTSLGDQQLNLAIHELYFAVIAKNPAIRLVLVAVRVLLVTSSTNVKISVDFVYLFLGNKAVFLLITTFYLENLLLGDEKLVHTVNIFIVLL